MIGSRTRQVKKGAEIAVYSGEMRIFVGNLGLEERPLTERLRAPVKRCATALSATAETSPSERYK